MKYQLVLTFPFLNESDFDLLLKVESEIETKLGRKHDVDGHDWGSGSMSIFVHTDMPEPAFESIKFILSKSVSYAPLLKIRINIEIAQQHPIQNWVVVQTFIKSDRLLFF